MNELNEFNNGGSHESNPYGGIPMGVNQSNGLSQTVEQGETMYNINGNDYIFSSNFKVNKEDVNNSFLPKQLIGKTMSDATKYIDKMFKDREDGVASKTKNEFLKRLSEVQEVKREEQLRLQAILDMNNQNGYVDLEREPLGEEVYDDQMNNIPQAEEMSNLNDIVPSETPTGGEMLPFQLGGFLGMSGMTGGQAVGQATDAVMSAVGSGMNLFNQFQGDTSTNSGMAALGGAATGASLGTAVLPGIGTGIGAGVGAVAGLFGANKARKREDRRLAKNATLANNQFRDVEQFDNGGYMRPKQNAIPLLNQPGTFNTDIKPLNIIPNFDPSRPRTGTNSYITPPPSSGLMNSFAMPNQIKPQTSQFMPSNDSAKTNSFKGLDTDSLMRGAPILNNFLQLQSQKKPLRQAPIVDTTKAQRRYIDNESMTRSVDTTNNNTLAAINQLGGSSGARRAAMLGSNIQRMKAMSDANAQTQHMNRQIDDRADALDAQTRAENLRREEIANENYAKDLGAYETNRSALQNTLYNSIGNIGLENRHNKTLSKMYGYDSRGNYIKDSSSTASAEGESRNTDNQTKNVSSDIVDIVTPKLETGVVGDIIGLNEKKDLSYLDKNKETVSEKPKVKTTSSKSNVVQNTKRESDSTDVSIKPKHENYSTDVSINPKSNLKHVESILTKGLFSNVNRSNNNEPKNKEIVEKPTVNRKEQVKTEQVKAKNVQTVKPVEKIKETVNNEDKTEKVKVETKVETPQTKTPQIESKPKASTDTTSRSKQQPEILDETSNNKSRRTSYNTYQSYSDYVYSVKNRTVGSNVPMSEEEYNKRNGVPKISNELNKITSDEKYDKNRDKKLKNRDSLLKYSSYQDYVNKVKAKNNNSKAAVLSEESFNNIRNYK